MIDLFGIKGLLDNKSKHEQRMRKIYFDALNEHLEAMIIIARLLNKKGKTG